MMDTNDVVKDGVSKDVINIGDEFRRVGKNLVDGFAGVDKALVILHDTPFN